MRHYRHAQRPLRRLQPQTAKALDTHTESPQFWDFAHLCPFISDGPGNAWVLITRLVRHSGAKTIRQDARPPEQHLSLTRVPFTPFYSLPLSSLPFVSRGLEAENTLERRVGTMALRPRHTSCLGSTLPWAKTRVASRRHGRGSCSSGEHHPFPP